MNVIIEDLHNDNKPLEFGDVILYKENYQLYLVTEVIPGKVAARNFDGVSGLMGSHDSLEAFNKEFIHRGLSNRTTIFRSSEYDLKLTRKGK